MRQATALCVLLAAGCMSGVDHAKVSTTNTIASHQVAAAQDRLAQVADGLAEDLIATQEAMILLELRLDLSAYAADGQLTQEEIKTAFDAAIAKRTRTVAVVRGNLPRLRTSVNLQHAKRLLDAQGGVLRAGAEEDAELQQLLRSIMETPGDGPVAPATTTGGAR